VLPKGIVSSGFPSVDATCRKLGLLFDPWQSDLNRCILAKGSDGLYAADTVAISIPRQVGKTWDIGALIFALCIITPGLTVVWTAHRFKVARETFESLRGVALLPTLSPHIDPDDITSGAGNEQIKFRNGSRIVFAARERGAVRGFSKVAILVLDEGQILTENALADLAPTTNQAENPLIIVMGTPPRPTDPGDVFRRLRMEALAGESDDVLFVEFSAARDADPDDRKAIGTANPSFPKRTTPKAIRRLRKLLTPEDYLREVLGIWDEDGRPDVFGPGKWEVCHTDEAPPRTGVTFGISRTIDLAWTSIGTSIPVGDKFHLGAVQHERSFIEGEEWVVQGAAALQEEFPSAQFVVAGRGPAGSLIPALEAAGVNVLIASTSDEQDAAMQLFDLVQERRILHRSYPELDDSVTLAVKRTIGDRWTWLRKEWPNTMLESAGLARWGSTQDVQAELEPSVFFI
jgi:hypothetical protein